MQNLEKVHVRELFGVHKIDLSGGQFKRRIGHGQKSKWETQTAERNRGV